MKGLICDILREHGEIVLSGHNGGNVMPVISGFGALAELPLERLTEKVERRVLAGRHEMNVWWKMKAGAHTAGHQHPHEQIVWMLRGKMDFRIGTERRSMVAGDVAVIPGNVEDAVSHNPAKGTVC